MSGFPQSTKPIKLGLQITNITFEVLTHPFETKINLSHPNDGVATLIMHNDDLDLMNLEVETLH